jgi:hypothetical protein
MGWSNHHKVGLIHYDDNRADSGYTFLCNAAGMKSNDSQAFLIDMNGRVCHRWYRPEGILHGYLLPNGNLLCRSRQPDQINGLDPMPGSAESLMEIDWESNIVWQHVNQFLHHDFQRLDNGNTLALVWEELPKNVVEGIQGGYESRIEPRRMFGDAIQEINHRNQVISTWSIWEKLNPSEDIICPLDDRRAWTHTNSIDVNGNGDFLLSHRQINTVSILSRSTGGFIWKWGSRKLSHQHDARFLMNGLVQIFDNGPHRKGMSFSRILWVDPETDKISWEYRADPIDEFYSFHISGAELLPSGNIFITEGASGRLFEITINGEVVWEYINPYYTRSKNGFSNSIFKAHRYHSDYIGLANRNLSPRSEALSTRMYIS